VCCRRVWFGQVESFGIVVRCFDVLGGLGLLPVTTSMEVGHCVGEFSIGKSIGLKGRGRRCRWRSDLHGIAAGVGSISGSISW